MTIGNNRSGAIPERAIILSAGQGRRLLPLTEQCPKCCLTIQDRSVLEWQIDTLFDAGIRDVCVVVGYGADLVEQLLTARYGEGRVRTLYNPFHQLADNLATCWVARHEMVSEFLLLNGDTLFEPAVIDTLLAAPSSPITLTVDRKAHYDDDDMKAVLGDGQRLRRVGKTLPAEEVNAESIGISYFRDEGPALFRATMERAMREPNSLHRWYLSVIDELAQGGKVTTCSIEGLAWAELDFPADLEQVKHVLAGPTRTTRNAT